MSWNWVYGEKGKRDWMEEGSLDCLAKSCLRGGDWFGWEINWDVD